ncbi:glutathione S-transferase [Gammaproteobacteria bacterium AS21]
MTNNTKITDTIDSYPVLYSLQNCPYAMRARLALLLSEQVVIIRAITLKNKPQHMLEVSPKGTVPVLILADGSVLQESIDIMLWALKQQDPHQLLLQDEEQYQQIIELIERGDNEFKHPLEQYRAAKRYHKDTEQYWRQQCEVFIAELEQRLEETGHFVGQQLSLADYAFIPFMRQFGRVDRKWFAQAPYPKVKAWLTTQLQSRLYAKMMTKHELWQHHAQNIFL